jgi:hypothetical protein
VAAEHFDRFLAVLGEVHRGTPVVEHLADHETIRSVVFRDQNAQIFQRPLLCSWGRDVGGWLQRSNAAVWRVTG